MSTQLTYKAQVDLVERQILLTAIEACVNNIWDRYDSDDNDHLDKKESKKFIMDVLKETGLFSSSISPEGDLRLVREVFHEIDSDKDRRISRPEMIMSIAKIIGLV
jgi:hypothetical protein